MRTILFSILISLSCGLHASRILIPMDETQKNHLKSYGLAFWVLQQEGHEVNWLLNYKGGSFMIAHTPQT
ncbi:MAG: asparagine synthetase B, partial [Bacteroidetes bacterium]|nr:asparagine synthetase B [Bacteroidota bacterium]